MPCASRAWPTAQRRRSGLRSFPRRCPSTPACPGSAQLLISLTSRSPAQVPSAVSPGPPADRHTPCANESTSAPRSPLPCRLVLSSYRSPPQLRSDAAGSLPAPVDTSCLVPSQFLSCQFLTFLTGTKFAGHSTRKRVFHEQPPSSTRPGAELSLRRIRIRC